MRESQGAPLSACIFLLHRELVNQIVGGVGCAAISRVVVRPEDEYGVGRPGRGHGRMSRCLNQFAVQVELDRAAIPRKSDAHHNAIAKQNVFLTRGKIVVLGCAVDYVRESNGSAGVIIDKKSEQFMTRRVFDIKYAPESVIGFPLSPRLPGL